MPAGIGRPARFGPSSKRARNTPVLVPFAASDVNLAIGSVDVTDLERQCFTETKPHRVGHQQKDTIAQFARRADQLLDLGAGENIRQGLNPRRLDEIEPGPVAFEDVLPEELETIAIDLNGAPGMSIDEFGEVALQLGCGELVGAAVEVLGNLTHRPRVGIDGLLAFPLQFQGLEMTCVESIESFLLGRQHDELHH